MSRGGRRLPVNPMGAGLDKPSTPGTERRLPSRGGVAGGTPPALPPAGAPPRRRSPPPALPPAGAPPASVI